MIPSSFWIILDKPFGMSSNHALSRVKRLFGLKKAGFSGTLDPLATGVLPVAFGQALKTMHSMTFSKKTYTFQIKWGESTTTDDAEGKIVERSFARPTASAIERILSQFTGDIEQTPPIYSALKVDGKRAYHLAKTGQAVTLQKRQVSIAGLTLTHCDDEDHATFEVVCSAGTYVRSLARDMAEALGTKGHVSRLRRTHVGCFFEKDAISLEKCREIMHTDAIRAYMHPVGIGLDDILAVSITSGEYALLMFGKKIPYTHDMNAQEERFLKEACVVGLWMCGQFAGFATYEEGMLAPKRMVNFDNDKDINDVDYKRT